MLRSLRLTIVILYLAVCCSANSQITIAGKIVNTNNEPLPYANIGFKGTAIGCVSDLNGKFRLSFYSADVNNSDSLKISCLGFKTKNIPAAQLSTDRLLEIVLEDDFLPIYEVVVTNRKLRSKSLGFGSVSAINLNCNFALNEFENQNLGSEIGTKLKLPNTPSHIDSIKFFLSVNNFDTVFFRLHFYTIKDNLPDKSLLSKNIICKVTEEETGWICIDLTPHNIWVQQDLIVTLEWIDKSKNGSALAFPIAMPVPHTHYYKFGSQNNWKVFKTMSTRMVAFIQY